MATLLKTGEGGPSEDSQTVGCQWLPDHAILAAFPCGETQALTTQNKYLDLPFQGTPKPSFLARSAGLGEGGEGVMILTYCR